MPRNRVQVTVSPEMRVALGILARRSGVTVSTQATVTLRQALDRTINSEECRQALITATSFRTVSEWRWDRAAAAEVSNALATVGE